MEKINTKVKKLKLFKDKFEFFKQEIDKNDVIVKDSNIYAVGIDNAGFRKNMMNEFVRKSELFPLKTITFEGIEFPAPNNSHAYLKALYGFYKKIPADSLQILRHVNVTGEEL